MSILSELCAFFLIFSFHFLHFYINPPAKNKLWHRMDKEKCIRLNLLCLEEKIKINSTTISVHNNWLLYQYFMQNYICPPLQHPKCVNSTQPLDLMEYTSLHVFPLSCAKTFPWIHCVNNINTCTHKFEFLMSPTTTDSVSLKNLFNI